MQYLLSLVPVFITVGIGSILAIWISHQLHKKHEIFQLKYKVYSDYNLNLNIIKNNTMHILEYIKTAITPDPVLLPMVLRFLNEISYSSNTLSSVSNTAKEIFKNPKIAEKVKEIENDFNEMRKPFVDLTFYRGFEILKEEEAIPQLRQIIDTNYLTIRDKIASIENTFLEIQKLIFKEMKIK